MPRRSAAQEGWSMTVVLLTPEPAVVSRFASGDENALVTLYRQEFDGLLAAAGEALGSDLTHYRGKVAHKAMLDAWQTRERFQNPTALAAFLEEAVRHEAAIQKRKHAALHHRHGDVAAHIAVPQVDEAVRILMDELHAPPVDHAAAVEEVLSAKRAHAKEHVERVAEKPRWLQYGAIGVVVVAAIFGAQRFLDNAGSEVAVDRALKGENVQNLTSGRGQRGTVTLRDGTRASMGSETRLSIPEKFGGTQRTVELEGTATFTVTPTTGDRQGVPFAVRAGTATVTATGTVFTVRSYPEDKAVYVQVTEGTVELKDRMSGTVTPIKAGDAVKFITDGTVTPLDGVARDVALAWTRDSIVFEQAPLRVVVPELVRWFGLNAVLADSSIGDRPVSMRVALASSGETTEALTKAADLTIAFGKNDRLEFNAAPAKPTANPRR
jgi:ferric-dicitrate binding protein FerR (iron transport regulator)